MTNRLRPYLPIVAVVLILVGVGTVVTVNNYRNQPGPPEVIPRSTRTGGKPNVLVIMTDDQTLESLRVMNNVQRYIARGGTTFSNYLVSFPNCCPSRATYMSGQLAHNDGVRDNVLPLGGYQKFNKDEAIGVWLQRAGYHTNHVGKFLNDWGADGNISAPPGWSHWYGLIDPTTYHYYDYSVSNDGRRLDFGSQPEDYQTDVLGNEVVRIIKERATGDQPWFLSWTPLAPHAKEGESSSGDNPGDKNDNDETNAKSKSIIENLRATLPDPAEEFKGKMAKEALPQPPSFNQKDVSKLPAFFRKKFPITFNAQGLIREGYQRELEALLSVDKWVGKIFTTLEKSNQLKDTVVIFTSDNGYYHGEHRITFSKVYLYEAGVHVPLLIRGGGFAAGAEVPAVAGNVDLAPTILGLAGATSPLVLDGRDLGAVARDPAKGEGRGMLLENWTESGKAHSEGIRTDRWKYLTNNQGEEELYDLAGDPHELNNLALEASFSPIKAELQSRLAKLTECAGATCEGSDAGRQ